jgi:hypothetical protein
MIEVPRHREILFGILKDLYQDPYIAPWLGFKGGTALYFFHHLPRFSVDLDFNLLVEEKHFKPELITEVLKKYIDIEIPYLFLDWLLPKNTPSGQSGNFPSRLSGSIRISGFFWTFCDMHEKTLSVCS